MSEEKQNHEESETVFNPIWIVHIELRHPIQHGAHKQSYCRYAIDSPGRIQYNGTKLAFIDSPDGVYHAIPDSNLVEWTVEHVCIPPLDGVKKGTYQFVPYRIPLGDKHAYYVGYYQSLDSDKCLAFLDEVGDVIYMRDIE